MRVLHFFKSYYPDSFGGVERTIHAIAKAGLAHGIKSDVLSLSQYPEKNSMMFDGHMAYKAKLNFEFASTGFSGAAFGKFSELSSRADLIHYHFPWPFMDLVHLLNSPRKPALVTYHSDIVKQKILYRVYRPLMFRFLSDVKMIVATSPNYAQTSSVLKNYQNKLEVIPLGLDEHDYPPPSDAVREKWKIQFSRPFLLFVGVLRYYKGLQFLIAAAKDIKADIVIVGEGPMKRSLTKQATELAADNVHFLGNVTDIDKAALLELCTAFVFPSHLRSEAYGLSLVEAAMFGKPMISCDIGSGTSFVNVHGKTGLVTRAGDPSALAGVASVLLADPKMIHSYGYNARKRYETELNSNLMALRYHAVYTRLLEQTPRTLLAI